ncbi:MAG: HDOD domain-containing protein [Cyanobacteria bacterium]|nr:HDOD domain-containing protein [Cyanobacteriota bacterium]MDA1021500.1 HDOD domain-containing protein [Cyanobacteriota bacterium]
MLEQSTNQKIDSFLQKSPSALRKLQEMATQTKEFPSTQLLIYKLMRLTNDVTTFDTELINYLSEDTELASLIIQKAKIGVKLPGLTISQNQLKQSIKRLGYGFVYNQVQKRFAREYVQVYYNTDNQHIKTLVKKSVRLAYIAKGIAKMINYDNEAQCFCAGINYYVGEMILGLRDRIAHNEIVKMQQQGFDKKAAELSVLGFDTGELAARKLEEWLLPDHIVNVVRNHDNPVNVKDHNYKIAILMKFAEFVNDALLNKQSGPHAMWDKAYDYLAKLDSRMTIDQWSNQIRLIYIQLLETEHALYQRKV